MPVATPGLVRLRKHQFGRQTDFGTPVAAVRALPFSGVPTVDLAWTDPEADMGSVDLISPPTRGPEELTASLNAPSVYYNDLVLMHSAMFGDAQTAAGAGAAKTWTYQPASLSADDLDLHTYEFGDDLDGTGGKPNDWFQLGDGLLESLTFTAPEGLGALSADMAWRFGMARYEGATESALQPTPAVPTAALSVDSAAVPVYLGDAVISIDSAHTDIGTTPIADALHSFTLTVTHGVDLKRLANGNGFDMSGYGRGARIIELSAQWAKTEDTVGVGSESDAWFSETAVNRFVEIEFTSGEFAQTAGSPDIPYSWRIRMPMRYYTREDGAIGGNSTITLVGRAFYHSTLGYALNSVIVNTLATAAL
jgi:hypothetical protein